MTINTRRSVLSAVSGICIGLAGCTSGDGGEQDSDNDGVVDSEDYAPNDPEVQEKSDAAGSSQSTTEPCEDAKFEVTRVVDVDARTVDIVFHVKTQEDVYINHMTLCKENGECEGILSYESFSPGDTFQRKVQLDNSFESVSKIGVDYSTRSGGWEDYNEVDACINPSVY